jgi:Nif-specific regulatory protein
MEPTVDDDKAKIWNAKTGKLLFTLGELSESESKNVEARQCHTADVTCVTFSDNGNWVLTGSADGTARLWEASTGRFLAADGGTIFLDEINSASPAMQVKLLRVLQEREFERLGGVETIRTNIRLIAATNKDLEKAIAAGEFREDLYYRLNVFAIFVPPLRERKPDVLLLADHFLEKFSKEHAKNVKRIATPAIDMLSSYHWPGNVRELANVIERAVVVCDSQVIHAHHLPPTLQTAEASGTGQTATLRDSLEAFEKDALQDALKSARGNRAKAARLLATTERIFNYRVRKYGIDWRRFKG